MNDDATRTALIVGGSGDIGRAVAAELGRAGFRLALAARDDARLRAAAEPLDAFAVACDITDEAQVGALVKAVEGELGGIDVLVNAAGASRAELLLRARRDTWHELLETNLVGAMLVCKAVARGMRARRSGLIVTIGSLAADRSVPGLAAYAASKAGLRALTDGLRHELADRGVRCTTISPGRVDTRMHGDAHPEAQRMLRPQDVAEAVAFLVRLSPTAVVPELVLDTVDS